MFDFLIKSSLVIGSCGSIAFLSTKWVKPQEIEAIHKINFNNQQKTIKEIKRLEDIDVWGKENGCNFIFVKNWEKKEIYTAKEFAEVNGGKDKAIVGWGTESEYKNFEESIVTTVNNYKKYCDYKLKTFTFLWNPAKGNFYIEDPNKQAEINKKATKAVIAKNRYFQF